jgi:Na+/H+ antiporter NhaC
VINNISPYFYSVIGAAIIVIGLYYVLGAEKMEKRSANDVETEANLSRRLLDEECMRK